MRGNVSRKKNVVEVEDDFRATVTVIVVSECFAFKRKAEFFAQFAQKRRFVALTGFDFAAGKFPVTRPGLVRRTFGDEELALRVFDDGSDDVKRDSHGCGPVW